MQSQAPCLQFTSLYSGWIPYCVSPVKGGKEDRKMDVLIYPYGCAVQDSRSIINETTQSSGLLLAAQLQLSINERRYGMTMPVI